MPTAWWWPSPLPAWLGSEALWFLALNVVVAAVAILSQSTPRRGGGAGITRRASSALLQSLRSYSIFSFPSASLSYLQPDAAAFAYQETEQLVRSPTNTRPSPHALALAPTPPPAPAAGEEGEDEEEGDPNAMSMDEAYALVLASRLRPEPEQEEEAKRSEVDARTTEDLIRGFNEQQRQQRLNSIFNYTQMLKRRGLAAGRQPEADARPDQL